MTWKNETTGQRLPAPLPMYEPVRLKHVPTFVRRRYDRDLNVIDDVNEGLSSEEGKSDGDGVEDDDPTAVSDVDDSVANNELKDDTHANLDTEHDTQSYREDFGSSNIESSSSTYNGDSNIKDDKDQDANDTSSYVDASVEDNTQDQSHAKSDMNDHGSYSKDCEDKDDEAKDVDLVSFVDASIENDVHDNEHGSNSIEQKDEVDGPEDATLIEYVDATVKNEVQDNEHGVYVGSHEQDNKMDDDGAKDEIVASWYENGSVQDKVQDDEHGNFNIEQGLPEEDDKSEGDGAEDVIYDAAGPDLDDIVDYEAEDDAQANFDTKHDIKTYTTENSDTNSLEETKCEGEIQHRDGASSVEASVDEDSIKDHGHDNSDINDQDFEEDGANNDVNIVYVDTSVNNGDHSNQHNEKDLLVEDCERIEDGTKDVTVASNYVDESVKLEEIIEKKHENHDIKQGLNLNDNFKIQGKGIEDEKISNYGDVSVKTNVQEKRLGASNDEQDFPEAFMKTLERDGYELCCPNCKHIITRTMIFRRREDCQQSKTTCFTFLSSLCKILGLPS